MFQEMVGGFIHADCGMLRRLGKQGVIEAMREVNRDTAHPSELHDPQDWL